MPKHQKIRLTNTLQYFLVHFTVWAFILSRFIHRLLFSQQLPENLKKLLLLYPVHKHFIPAQNRE